MQENKNTSLPWYNADGVDAPGDEIPELTPEVVNRANVYVNGKLVRRRGRPIAQKTKASISIRLDKDIIEFFKSKGKGWQSEINAYLRKAMI